MELSSCLYECEIWHHRFSPKTHAFKYKVYMFYLDLDEIDTIAKKLFFFSRNHFNLYNFRDSDHLQLENAGKDSYIKSHICQYLISNGINERQIGSVKLITNVATAGYIFNPVSFYYVFDTNHQPLCSIVEVRNTFLELKPYFLSAEDWDGKHFAKTTTKHFYVSPFIRHDAEFHFQLSIPGEILKIKINDTIDETTIIKTGVNGKKKPLNDLYLVYYFLTIPLVTIKIIIAIHWEALMLFMKRITYFKKNENQDLQRNYYTPHNSQK